VSSMRLNLGWGQGRLLAAVIYQVFQGCSQLLASMGAHAGGESNR
jgi:hypothetical protein